eukprot:768557-Hanusia_phi.AAC.6
MGKARQIRTCDEFLVDLSSQDFNNIPKAEFKNIQRWFRSVCDQMFDGKKMRMENYTSDAEEEHEVPGWT